MTPEIKELIMRTSDALHKEKVHFLFLATDKESLATSYEGSLRELENLLYKFIGSQRVENRIHVATMIARAGMSALFVENKEAFIKMKGAIDVLFDTIHKEPQGTPSNPKRDPYKIKKF